MEFLEHRIADRRVLRLIRKWLAAGVIEDGSWSETPEGTPQGGSASPLLANVYLHYVLDRWARQWRARNARGDMIIVRWADDFVVGFEHRGDARQFLSDLRERFAKFGLELHPDKMRLIQFGRYAAGNRKERGLGKPETFAFLGFTHICGKGQERTVLAKTHHDQEADARKAQGGLRPTQATPAPAHSRARTMAGQRAAGPLRLLRSARQRPDGGRFPVPVDPTLAQGATASQSAPPAELGAHAPPRSNMAPTCQDHASLPGGTLRRSYLRQEPGAGIPHAGICAGGRPQGRSLPQPEPSTAPSCASSPGASTNTSSDGPCRSSNGCEANQPGHGPGSMLSDSTMLACSPTGTCFHGPPADLWGPDEARASRPVLREREGEVPSRHSPDRHVRF